MTPREFSRACGVARPDRWMAEITYRDGSAPKTVSFEEFVDLGAIVEAGVDWNEIEQIVVTLNRPSRARRRIS